MATIHHVGRVDLTIDPDPLPWEAENEGAIAEHWKEAVVEKPTLFNGIVYMATAVNAEAATLSANVHPMRFAGLTWWRELGMPPSGFHSIFGDIVLRGSDGGLLMARTAAHTATGGMLGFPGGTFDENDIDGDRLDPMSCILRECEEETGWSPDELDIDGQYLVYEDQARLAVSVIADMGVTAEEGAARVRATLAAQDQPELDEIHVVHGENDLNRIAPHPYSRLLANWIFQNA